MGKPFPKFPKYLHSSSASRHNTSSMLFAMLINHNQLLNFCQKYCLYKIKNNYLKFHYTSHTSHVHVMYIRIYMRTARIRQQHIPLRLLMSMLVSLVHIAVVHVRLLLKVLRSGVTFWGENATPARVKTQV